jgi:hypothetical protein
LQLNPNSVVRRILDLGLNAEELLGITQKETKG